MDAYSLAFAPIRAAQETTTGALQQLEMLQNLRLKPQMAAQQSQDSLLRSLGDLLPPEAINQILQQRMPELSGMQSQNQQMPMAVTPEQLAMFQQMLQPQQQ